MNGKRMLLAAPVVAISVVAFALLSAPSFDSFKSTLLKAEGVSATVQVNSGDIKSDYKIDLAKPDKVRIETESQLIVADGKDITTFLKGKNQYYSVPQTAQALAEVMSPMEYQVWTPFFSEKAFAKVARVEKSGERKLAGQNHDVIHVEADAKGDTKMDFYINQKSKMPSRLSISSKTLTGTSEQIMALNDVTLGANSASLYAFSAPEGAEKVDLSTMNAGVWGWDFKKALDQAQASGKLVMIDFMADWCGPCKMMEAQVFHTDEFKKATANMILVKVDVDVSTDIAAKYGIEAMPTCKFVNGKGEVIHEFVGYGGFDQVMGEVNTAKSKFGK